MKLKENIIGRDEGFVVQTLFIIFYLLERISLFYWIRELSVRRAEKKNVENPFVKSYIFPEIWAVGNIVIAIVSHYLAIHTSWKWVLYILIGYAIERTFEMFVYQVNVLFFHRMNSIFLEPDDKKKRTSTKVSTEEYVIKSSTRMVIMLIFNMVEYVLQFAVIFAAIGSLQQDPTMHISLLESFQVFMSLGGLEVYSSGILMTVAYIESIIGIFMNILCLARFVGILPEVRERGYSVEKK